VDQLLVDCLFCLKKCFFRIRGKYEYEFEFEFEIEVEVEKNKIFEPSKYGNKESTCSLKQMPSIKNIFTI